MTDEKTKYLEQLLKDIIASSGDDREELLKEAEHFLSSEEDGMTKDRVWPDRRKGHKVVLNLAEVENRMINYYCQALQAENPLHCLKDVVNINLTELNKQAIKEHKDIHKLVASKIFNVPYDEVTDEQRLVAKTRNFRALYNGGIIK